MVKMGWGEVIRSYLCTVILNRKEFNFFLKYKIERAAEKFKNLPQLFFRLRYVHFF
jgi:hypothetical protein